MCGKGQAKGEMEEQEGSGRKVGLEFVFEGELNGHRKGEFF